MTDSKYRIEHLKKEFYSAIGILSEVEENLTTAEIGAAMLLILQEINNSELEENGSKGIKN